MKLFSAFAIADSNSFLRIGAVFFGVKLKISIASATFLPLTKLATKLAEMERIVLVKTELEEEEIVTILKKFN